MRVPLVVHPRSPRCGETVPGAAKKGTTHAQTQLPGRLTHEQWRALPHNKRRDLAMRAQCDLMGSFRHCKHKLCRRARTCSGDANACLMKLWHLIKTKPKTLLSEHARLEELPYA